MIFAFTVLATTAWTPVALANEFPAVIPLSSLDGIIGFRVDGTSGGVRSAANAGDVNGDGFADIIIGAPEADPHGVSSGSSYVVFGKASGYPKHLDPSSLDGSNGFRIDGASTGEYSGFSVSSAGDVNGDGFADVIICAPYASFHSGLAYVVFGGASFPATVDLSSLNGANGFRLNPAGAGDFTGRSAASAGDVNGDGFADLIIGAPWADPHGSLSGSSYVVFGRASGYAATLDLSSLDGSNGFRVDGQAMKDISGISVAGTGDVNGDGLADVIIGAFGADPHGSQSGSTYVVYGKISGFSASLDLSTLDGSNGFRLDGVRKKDDSGISVASAGDVNGDGLADIIIGAFGSASSYVVFGKDSGFDASIRLSTLNGSNGFRIDGVTSDDGLGFSVGGAGDVNGDGFADIIIGAPDAAPHGPSSGSSYVVFGKASGFAASLTLSILDGTNGFRLDGVDSGDDSGWSVSSAGDINGDGFADVIIGAFQAELGSGASYVVVGRAPDSARTRVGSAAGQYISGGPFDDTLQGNLGDDVLEGRGGADVLNGGFGSDTASYLHSAGPVKASLRIPSKNTGDAAGDSYDSIENLTGSRFADTLIGNGLANRLTGAQGSDLLFSGLGADLFVYNAVSDSPAGAGRDRIGEFEAGTATTSADKIDLRAIDAKTGPGNQAFKFIGTRAFSGKKGELRVEPDGTSTIIQGDVNGDGVADLELELLKFTSLSTLTALDFGL